MENTKFIYLKLFVSLGISFQLGCAPKKKGNSESAASPPEESYCSTALAVSNPVTLTGSAEYQYLKPAYSKVIGEPRGLTLDTGNVPFVKPIRYAEVRVKNSAGAIVQCAETDASGSYSVQVEKPATSETYSIEVNSRADNNMVKASILDRATSKKVYSVAASQLVRAEDSSITVQTITALATGNIEGGAFNIFDKIVEVNSFLRSNTTNPDCSLCQGFTVAPKVTVYWIKGFNPASYLGEESGLSFFDASGSIDSTPSLYILGGSNGDVDYADTDHFDESVIIHEYGHFLERHFWRTHSPGGVHNGNLIIDPRLAFSEGFANFLPAAITNTSEYIDTIGSPFGNTQVGVYLDLESEPTSQAGRDFILTRSPIGEGVYREVSVARVLNDYIDSSSDLTYDIDGNNNVIETSNVPFAFLWLALTNTNFGLNAPHQYFVSIGHFNRALHDGLTAAYTAGDLSTKLEDIAKARNGEFQTNGTTEYAQLLKKSSTTCTRSMTPVPNRLISKSSEYYHDLFASNDFFRIDHPGGLLNLELSYAPTQTNNPPDLDLYVYRERHSLGDSGDLVGASDKCRSGLAINGGRSSLESPVGSEVINTNLAAGTYMIVVNAVTTPSFSGGPASYELRSGGQSLCNSQ